MMLGCLVGGLENVVAVNVQISTPYVAICSSWISVHIPSSNKAAGSSSAISPVVFTAVCSSQRTQCYKNFRDCKFNIMFLIQHPVRRVVYFMEHHHDNRNP